MTELESVKQALSDLFAEDAELASEAQRNAKRRAQIQNAIIGLVALEEGRTPEYPGGLADAIRAILRAEPDRGFTPIDVRTGLKILKFPLDAMSNPLAHIHSILKRFFDAGEVVRIDGGDGSTRYSWKEPPSFKQALIGVLKQEAPKRTASDSLKERTGVDAPPQSLHEALGKIYKSKKDGKR